MYISMYVLCATCIYVYKYVLCATCIYAVILATGRYIYTFCSCY